jgi:preprotein translocase subunit SecE
VARDRKRAKRRRDRRSTTAEGRVDGSREGSQSTPVRADLPGSLDHASGEVDEFDAALLRGAGGVAATPEAGLEDDRGADEPEEGAELGDSPSGVDDGVGSDADHRDAGNGSGAGAALADGSGPDTLSEREIEKEAVAEGDLDEKTAQELQAKGAVATPEQAPGARIPEHAPGARIRWPQRAVAFLQASWAELQRVQWPDRRQVTQATAVVLGFVAIAGAYLGVADVVAKEIVEFIL